MSSRLPVQDLAELFDVEFDEDDVETVGGLFGLVLGRVPLPGAVVELHGLELIAEGGPNRQGRVRITSVVVHRVPEKELEKKKKRKKKRDVAEAETVDTADHQPDTAERTTQLHEEAS